MSSFQLDYEFNNIFEYSFSIRNGRIGNLWMQLESMMRRLMQQLHIHVVKCIFQTFSLAMKWNEFLL